MALQWLCLPSDGAQGGVWAIVTHWCPVKGRASASPHTVWASWRWNGCVEFQASDWGLYSSIFTASPYVRKALQHGSALSQQFWAVLSDGHCEELFLHAFPYALTWRTSQQRFSQVPEVFGKKWDVCVQCGNPNQQKRSVSHCGAELWVLYPVCPAGRFWGQR